MKLVDYFILKDVKMFPIAQIKLIHLNGKIVYIIFNGYTISEKDYKLWEV